MAIDFHDEANRYSYSGRDADDTWRQAVSRLVGPAPGAVVDVGCGGGIYTRAWSEVGAVTVTGVDSSAPVLAVARDSHGHLPGVTFRRGDATSTGLPAGSADVVFERALVHHTPDLAAVVAEARRLLRPGGVHLVQDRSRADSSQPGSASHPRGWFFEVFPHLTDVEDGRRPSPERLGQVLGAGGFSNVSTTSLWEVRRRHDDREDYLAEIAQRTGRSILHYLTDAELEHLVVQLRRRLPAGPVIEQDRWTLWRAERDPA